MRKSLMCFLFLPCIAFGCSETVDVTPPAKDSPAVSDSAAPASDTESTGSLPATTGSEPAAK